MTKSEIEAVLAELGKIGAGVAIGSEKYDEICKQITKKMSSSQKTHYISIDLRQSDLRTYYSATNPEYAYSEIRNFLKANGFDSRKDTNYISRTTIGPRKLSRIINSLNQHFPWLVVCAKKIDVTIMENATQFDALTTLTTIATINQSLDEIREDLMGKVQEKENAKEENIRELSSDDDV